MLWHPEIDVFLELSCFFDDPVDVDNLISGSFAFSKTSFNILKFKVHVFLKPGLENFEHYFTNDASSTILSSPVENFTNKPKPIKLFDVASLSVNKTEVLISIPLSFALDHILLEFVCHFFIRY